MPSRRAAANLAFMPHRLFANVAGGFVYLLLKKKLKLVGKRNYIKE